MTRLTLRFDFSTGAQLGPGKIRLLELIRAHGSIRSAGAEMGMSYRRSWLLADSLNRMFRQTVIDRQRGGRSGGGASLTEFGADLVSVYRRMEPRAEADFSREIDSLNKALDPDFQKKSKSGGDDT